MQTDSNSLFSIERKRVANFSAYAKAALPAAGSAGRIARVTDSVRGLWMDSGSQFFGLNGEVVNVREQNATGDGATDDRTAFSNAVTAAAAVANGAAVQVPSGTYRIGSALTIPANVILQMLPGAKLTVDVGITITVAGDIDARPSQHIFTGAGTVAFTSVGFGAGSWAQTVYPEWWGAIPDAVTDCGPAVGKALNSGAGSIEMQAGIYGIGTRVVITTANWSWRGISRVNSVLVPLVTSFAGINSLFVCNNSTANWHIENLRFLSPGIAYTGWYLWAEEDSPDSESLFSTHIVNNWITPGSTAAGFFHGGMSTCYILGNNFEFCGTAFDLIGPIVSMNVWDNNVLDKQVAFFINATGGSNINSATNTISVNQKSYSVFHLEDAVQFHIDGLQFEFNGLSGASPPVALEGGIAEFIDCEGCSFNNFSAIQLAGLMYGIKCTSSEVTISNGRIYDATAGAATTVINTVAGTASEVTFTNVKTFDCAVADYGIAGSGNVQLNQCDSIRSASYCVLNTAANSVILTARGCRFINSSYNAGGSSVGMIQTNSSGAVYYVDCTFRVDDAASTPTGVFAHVGSGDFLVDNNIFSVGAVPLSVGGSATQLMKLGRNHGLATTYFASGIPTTGSWKVGDQVLTTVVVESGAPASKYVIKGWIRITSGSGNVLNTDWYEMRTLTGN